MTFGAKLKQIRIERNLTQEELAKILKTSKQVISRYENEQRTPKISVAKEYATILNVSLEYLIDDSRDYQKTVSDDLFFSIPGIMRIPKMKKIPLLGTIACGEPILAEENIDTYIPIDENFDATFALKCKGDSMITARIFDGDIVYIRPQPDVENGEIAAVLIDNEATLKKVYKAKNKITLSPCNPMYADMVYTDEQLNQIKILGKAVAFTSVIRNS